MEYTIREMQQQDLMAVTGLEASCFSQPWKYQDFEDVLTNPHRIYLVAETSGHEIIGGCMLTEIAGEGDISNVAVNEVYRGKHIATALLNELIRYGKETWNIEAFTLEVRSQNKAAIKLYENAGFVSEGIRPHFYEQPVDDALIMWLRVTI